MKLFARFGLFILIFTTLTQLPRCGIEPPPTPDPTATFTPQPTLTPTATFTPQPTLAPTATFTPAPPPPSITIQSNPPGAEIEIGIQEVGSVLTYGTGRIVGKTPMTVELMESDVVVNETHGYRQLNTMLRLEGYFDALYTLSLSAEDVIEPGFHEEIFVALDEWAPEPSVTIETDPPGAEVEIGVQAVDNILTRGTGRIVGYTPLTVDLLPSDIERNYNNIEIYLTKPGYVIASTYIDLGNPGEYVELEPGFHKVIFIRLEEQ